MGVKAIFEDFSKKLVSPQTLRTVATEPVGHRADGASREEPEPTRGTARTGPDRAEPSRAY